MNSAMYPVGSKGLKSRYVAGVLTFFNPADGVTVFSIDPATATVTYPDTTALKVGGASLIKATRNHRQRCTIAQVNAGVSLLAAIPGYKYRIMDIKCISVGGAAAAVTTVDVLGTQSTSSVKLAAFAQASLTQSAVLSAGGSGGAVLADGASFVACDANTGITANKTGSSVTTATHIDFIISYAVEA